MGVSKWKSQIDSSTIIQWYNTYRIKWLYLVTYYPIFNVGLPFCDWLSIWRFQKVNYFDIFSDKHCTTSLEKCAPATHIIPLRVVGLEKSVQVLKIFWQFRFCLTCRNRQHEWSFSQPTSTSCKSAFVALEPLIDVSAPHFPFLWRTYQRSISSCSTLDIPPTVSSLIRDWNRT